MRVGVHGVSLDPGHMVEPIPTEPKQDQPQPPSIYGQMSG